MRRILIAVVVCVLALPSVALAQTTTSNDSAEEIKVDETPDLFSWYPDTGLGVLFGIAAGAGALFTMFFLVGGAVPGIAGQARIDAQQARLEQIEKQLAEQTADPAADAGKLNAVGRIVNELRDDVNRERWTLFAVASVLYVVLGVFFALLIAHDVLQALLVGAGWTGVAGSLGLKTDYEARKDTKDAVIQDLVDTPVAAGGAGGEALPEPLKNDVQVAKAL